MSVQWNKSDHFIMLPNGSEYWIGGLEDEKRVEKILGREFSGIHFNEITQMSYRSVQLALTRLSEKNSLKKKAFYDFNPAKKTHWSYHQFIKKINPTDNQTLPDPDNYAWMKMNPIDNLNNIDHDYLKMLQSLPEKERTRFLDGEFSSDDDGQAYYAFDREQHVTKIDSSFHVGQKASGMDFNVNPMTAAIGYYVNRTFFVTSEAFLPNSDTFKMSNHLLKTGNSGLKIYPDSTGKNRRTSGISDHAILEKNGFTVMKTRNPMVVDRVNNMNRLFQEGRIIIDESCQKLIADLEKVSWKDGDLDQKTDPMLTHISDALSYWCWAVDPLLHDELPFQQSQL
jgi:hypothetical protein